MITLDMLENYEVDKPEPAIRTTNYGRGRLLEDVATHIQWLNARWQFFKDYIQAEREKSYTHYDPNN